ncbi:MAG: gliding motility protein [Myxococcales bacterium]|nr:gliding motility protein [Myxococcales bacterium]
MQLDFRARELTLKFVYYGPSHGGKTTNLRALQDRIAPSHRSKIITLDANDDRTLFLDLLPLSVTIGDVVLRLNLYTVPGKPLLAATRRLVLQGVDGVAFVADSRTSEARANAESFVDLKQNLRDAGRDIRAVPLVIQFNKRDVEDARPDAELDALADRGSEPVLRAVATRGEGVTETFVALLDVVLRRLDSTGELARTLRVDATTALVNITSTLGLSTDLQRACFGGGGARQP